MFAPFAVAVTPPIVRLLFFIVPSQIQATNPTKLKFTQNEFGSNSNTEYNRSEKDRKKNGVANQCKTKKRQNFTLIN